MKVGIDIGQTCMQIAFIYDDKEAQIFEPESSLNSSPTTIPTAIAYKKSSAKSSPLFMIGISARETLLGTQQAVFSDNFTNNLERDEPLKDFLGQLLKDFEQAQRTPDGIVLAVPDSWYSQPEHPEIHRVTRILRDDLNVPLLQVRSAAVCAAAYYIHSSKTPFTGNLLVCDMGGHAFTATLCRIAPGSKIRVVDAETGVGLAGCEFDQNAARAAWKPEHGRPPDMHASEFLKLLYDFEEHRIQLHAETSEQELRQFLDTHDPDSEQYDPAFVHTPLYEVDKTYRFSYPMIQEAFAPIRQNIVQVLTTLQQRLQQQAQSIDRIMLVGGFGQYFLVQRTVRECFPEDACFAEFGHAGKAIAFGAAIIADGRIDPSDYNPHALGIRGYETDPFREIIVPVVRTGVLPTDRPDEVYFAHDALECRRIFTVETDQKTVPLQIYAQTQENGHWQKMLELDVQYPPPGKYHLGLSLDEATFSLLLSRADAQQAVDSYKYVLGNLESESDNE